MPTEVKTIQDIDNVQSVVRYPLIKQEERF